MKSAIATVCAVALFSCGTNTSLVASPGDTELENDAASASDALSTNRASVWFPMQEGNTWTLQSASGESRTVTLSNVFDGVGYLSGLDQWLGTTTSAPNTLYMYDEVAETWDPFIRFGYAVTPWVWGSGACSTYDVKRAPNAGPLMTPAGTFSDVRIISFERQPSPTARCMPPAFTALTFAPHVGLVAIQTYDQTFLLASATVKGKSYPLQTGIAGKLSFDKTEYINTPNTIRCITTPCPSNAVTAVAQATYTVTNFGPKSETFQFNTGCQFDVTLINNEGKTVRSLSDDRFCTQALTSFTLKKGESKTFSAQLSLENDDGQLFGDFTAAAALLVRNAAATAEAKTRFTVSEPPAP